MNERLVHLEEHMLTKEEFRLFVERNQKENDAMMVILKRLDEERYFTAQWVQPIEDESRVLKARVDEHERVLMKVKQDLHIA